MGRKVKHQRVSWVPSVGMIIENFNPGGKKSPNGLAEILAVLDDGMLRIRHHESGRTTHLMRSTAVCNWRPYVPAQAQIEFKNVQVASGLSEADIRRIVRDELRMAWEDASGPLEAFAVSFRFLKDRIS